MKVPKPWLEEYVKVDLKLKDLMWKMTEIGMTTESFEKVDGEIVLDVEVTPNRPDWLSILGIAREVAAIQNSNIKFPKTPKIPNKDEELPIDVDINHKLSQRYTAITIANVNVKDSPDKIKKYLKLMGLRPINNLVDITNYVMFELGVPIHVFDYDKIKGKKIKMQMSKGGEEFTSVDGITYELPESAIIFKDKKRVIDLCGIKGGLNTSISEETKNIYIHVPVYTPVMIRRTSQNMKLSSEASYIYERGAHAGGTEETLKRVVDLILKNAGGNVASEVLDIKGQKFVANRIVVDKENVDKKLGIELTNRQVVKLLKSLDLRPESRGNTIYCQIPTYRQDIQIEEDILEEIARMHGYNNFPRTFPDTTFREEDIPMKYDHDFEMELKRIMKSGGYKEVNTLSLISGEAIENCKLELSRHIKLQNPVSQEYEYMRASILPGLISSVKTNKTIETIKMFEYGKVFQGPIDKRKEKYKLSAISNIDDLRKVRGIVDHLFWRLNIQDVTYNNVDKKKTIWHPENSLTIEKDRKQIGTFGFINPTVTHKYDISKKLFAIEFDVQGLKSLASKYQFQPVTKYPPHLEDVTISLSDTNSMADILSIIKTTSSIIREVEIIDVFDDKYTLRIKYLHKGKTLTDKEIEKLRNKFIKRIKKKGVQIDL